MWLQNLTSRDIYMTETMLTFSEFGCAIRNLFLVGANDSLQTAVQLMREID